ncbi:aldehyde dehydrogenase family protein [Nocardia sp. NPDC019395]|uniref:aldehyde dehydrogenase family protein n=1 Tax=Nocardia sp. NPDC019395 TaxID=3154686 RepID=UPI0033E3D235
MTSIPHWCSYVAGKWLDGGDTFTVENPADESVVAEVAAASVGDFGQAIEEARRSFDSGVWADLPARERARKLHAFLDHLEAVRTALVDLIVAESGQPVFFAEGTQFRTSLTMARETIELYLSMTHEEANPVPVAELIRGGTILSIRRYEPVGVVAAITPYNAALIMGLQKLIPALMAGASVVVRPSPLTPISSLMFGAAAEVADIPAGVLSVVVEPGAAGAELLTTHPAVDMVSFTGSTSVGRMILAQAAPTVKRVALELGGKSAQIYLPDAVERAARGAAAVVAATAGQACVAATRMLVPQDRKDEVVEAVAQAYAGITVGPPSDRTALMGPVISAAQRERCERYVALACGAGARVASGGGRPAGLDRGYYFEPTVLDLPDNDNPAAREEIFGPVLGVIGYRDVDDAVRIANDSDYGLSGQVYGADVAAATAVARRLRTGAVSVNAGLYSAYAPSGGYKHSGLGRERGTDGIRAFQELKHMSVADLR